MERGDSRRFYFFSPTLQQIKVIYEGLDGDTINPPPKNTTILTRILAEGNLDSKFWSFPLMNFLSKVVLSFSTLNLVSANFTGFCGNIIFICQRPLWWRFYTITSRAITPHRCYHWPTSNTTIWDPISPLTESEKTNWTKKKHEKLTNRRRNEFQTNLWAVTKGPWL